MSEVAAGDLDEIVTELVHMLLKLGFAPLDLSVHLALAAVDAITTETDDVLVQDGYLDIATEQMGRYLAAMQAIAAERKQ